MEREGSTLTLAGWAVENIVHTKITFILKKSIFIFKYEITYVIFASRESIVYTIVKFDGAVREI